jgi:hypothetical protein
MFRHILNLFIQQPLITNLGRWCNVSLPNCSEKVINRKIEFALTDHNICTFTPFLI